MCEFCNGLYLILIDYYSKWIEVVKINSQTTEAVAYATKRVASSLGVPACIHSDNRPRFASAAFRSFADARGVLAT